MHECFHQRPLMSEIERGEQGKTHAIVGAVDNGTTTMRRRTSDY